MNIGDTLDQGFFAGKETSALRTKRLEIAKKYCIDLDEPDQAKRVNALFNLFSQFLSKSEVIPSLKNKMIGCIDKLIECIDVQIKEINEASALKLPGDYVSTVIKNVKCRDSIKIKKIKNEMKEARDLIFAFDNQYSNPHKVESEMRVKLSKVKDVCWEDFQKTLDVSKELRNCVIGYQNRLTLFQTTRNFIDFAIHIENLLNEALDDIQDLKLESVEFFYDILRHYSLPQSKQHDFKLFLQKKIESKLNDAVDLKASLGLSYDRDLEQITAIFREMDIKEHQDREAIILMSNSFKESVLKKQVSFSEDIDSFRSYLKTLFRNKSELLWENFEMFKRSMENDFEADVTFSKSEVSDFIEIENKKNEQHLEIEKMRIMSEIRSIEDNFFKSENIIARQWTFDKEVGQDSLISLRQIKLEKIDELLCEMRSAQDRIKKTFEDGVGWMENFVPSSENEFKKIVLNLQTDCDWVCSELFRVNKEFWVKVNGEFNSEIRRHLIMLHYRNAPWTKNWRVGNCPWMKEYLICNLSSTYLDLVGRSLRGISPESKLFVEASKALSRLNELNREAYKRRDLVEFEQLISLNTMPVIEVEALDRVLENRMSLLKSKEKNLRDTELSI